MDAEHDDKRLDDKAGEDLARAKREHAQAERMLKGWDLDCRHRLKRISTELAAAVNNPGVSAMETRAWLEDKLRETRDNESRDMVHHSARFAERMRNQLEKLLTALLQATAEK